MEYETCEKCQKPKLEDLVGLYIPKGSNDFCICKSSGGRLLFKMF